MMRRNNERIEDLMVGIFWDSSVYGDIRQRPGVPGFRGTAAEFRVSLL
ncbi:hypothetical protein ACFL5Q_00630 [Planctomycetota bacterium]